MKKNVAFLTTTRADYGLIRPLLAAIDESDALDYQLLVAGTHLSGEHGHTVDHIENDGFTITARLNTHHEEPETTASTTLLQVAEALQEHKPDLFFANADRFEMLAATQAAALCRLPIAHLYGGDETTGAYDNAFRHAITKLSHLHFCSNEEAAGRIRQMGEVPAHVHNVGSPALDFLHSIHYMSRKELEESLGFSLQEKLIIATYHPETLSDQSPQDQIDVVLSAINELDEGTTIIFTGCNSDHGGDKINAKIENFAASRSNVHFMMSLGLTRYFSLLKLADMAAGNTSSGLYEVPSFKIPTINIGNRQTGRLKATSVIDCPCETQAITAAIEKAWGLDCSDAVNPYGDGHSSKRIVDILTNTPDWPSLVAKSFQKFKIKNIGEAI